MASESCSRKVVIKDMGTGRYLNGAGQLVDGKSQAHVYDWEADRVAWSLKKVKELHGATWVAEDPETAEDVRELPESLTSILGG